MDSLREFLPQLSLFVTNGTFLPLHMFEAQQLRQSKSLFKHFHNVQYLTALFYRYNYLKTLLLVETTCNEPKFVRIIYFDEYANR